MMQSCVAEVRAGNFKSYARWLGVIDVILMLAVPILTIVTNRLLPPITFGLLVAFSVIAGVIELPLCCSCFQCCRWCGGKMSWFKHFLLRAFMYACMSAILFVVSALQENSPAGWYFGIANGINTFLYIFAHFKGEVAGNEAADEGIMRDMAREKVREQAMAAASGVARDPKVQAAALDAAKDPKNQKVVVDLAAANPGFAAAAFRAAAKV